MVFLLVMEISAQTSSAGRNAGQGEFPRMEPEPKALEYARLAARSEGYSWADLAEISLWASGDAGRDGPSYMRRIRAAATELQLSPELPASGRERAEYILAFTHKKFLKTYSFNQTRLDTLLSNGRYNCVSSAVLYMILAKSAGLDVSGVMTKDHAFASVHINGETIDVETTNPYGFDPGSRREFHDQFGKLTGFAYVPSRSYRDRTAISPIELVSLILSNRISELETRNHFAEAVPLSIDRAALLMGEKYAERPAPAGKVLAVTADTDSPALFFEDPRRDMMNRLFNYGAFLLKAGREEDCVRWVVFAAPQYPDEKRWEEFVLAAVNYRVLKMVKSGQTDAARGFLDNQKMALNPAAYALLDSMLIDTELLTIASKIRNVKEGESILAAIEQARNSKRLNDERAAELLTFTIQKTAEILSAAPVRDWLGAINYIEQAITRFGSSGELEQTLRNYRTNRAADFHNRFAAAYNKRNFDAAARILNEALAEFPDNRQLLADKKAIE
jgi:hypothetical protein